MISFTSLHLTSSHTISRHFTSFHSIHLVSLHLIAPGPSAVTRSLPEKQNNQEDCYGADRFNGWTPMNEEGKSAEDIDLEEGVWRRPFRSESVIYGRLRGEDEAPQ